MCVENGYGMSEVKRVITQVRERRTQNNRTAGELATSFDTNDQSTTITLPWIPRFFKSGSNLKNIICLTNKTKLQHSSYPGIYKVNCRCKMPYTAETKFKIYTRGNQHLKNVMQNKLDYSGIVQHSHVCEKGIEWDSLTTLKVETNRFERKVQEALEIQYNEFGLKKGGMNLDNGQYVSTKFWSPYF